MIDEFIFKIAIFNIYLTLSSKWDIIILCLNFLFTKYSWV